MREAKIALVSWAGMRKSVGSPRHLVCIFVSRHYPVDLLNPTRSYGGRSPRIRNRRRRAPLPHVSSASRSSIIRNRRGLADCSEGEKRISKACARIATASIASIRNGIFCGSNVGNVLMDTFLSQLVRVTVEVGKSKSRYYEVSTGWMTVFGLARLSTKTISNLSPYLALKLRTLFIFFLCKTNGGTLWNP